MPFTLVRSDDAMSQEGFTSTSETIHGLLRLEAGELLIQWRVARETNHMGEEIRSDTELEPVREAAIPLGGVAGAVVRRRWWEWLRAPRLVLTAADLRAFEGVTGNRGLRMSHPAELVLPLRRSDRLAAEEFSAELALAVAELAVRDAGRLNEIEGDAGAQTGTDRLPPALED